MKYQPWSKLMADLPERKAHYTDAQFRAFIELLAAAAAARTPGTFPTLAAVRRITGASTEFLVEQGDLDIADDGTVSIHGWKRYQRPFDEGHAARQAAYEQRRHDAEHDASYDANTVSSVERQNGSSTSTSSSSSSTKTENVPVAADFDVDGWTSMMQVAEDMTGMAYALGSPTSKLGQMVLAQVRDFGLARTSAAWGEVNRQRPDLNVMPSVGQLVLGADNLLRPIPKVNGKQLAAEEEGRRDREAAARRREATRKLIDEQRAREH